VKPRLLVVDDEPAIRIALKGLLDKQGYDVALAAGGDEAIEALTREPCDLVLVDLALGRGKNGLDVLAASRAAQPGTPVILMTAHGSEKVAVQAMKAGAHDYVPKPFDNDEMTMVVQRALERTRLEREHRLLLDRVAREHGLGAMIGASGAMRRVFETIHKVAETDLTVLVHGESGTGKELVAQALHERSARRTRPFVAVNCAAMSRDLVESELFGHEKGAFTGAGARRAGRFESADGGTLFLDEIGDMPRETQAKVLRVLQERSFERVGGTATLRVDVRVVAATNRDLEAEVQSGAFRQDLYYRLRVVEIQLPPLRERPDDIPALVDRFLTEVALRLGRPKATMSAPAMATLATHRWPGNVRELRNLVERAAVLSSGTDIDASDLGLETGKGAAPTGTFADAKRRAIEDFERSYLRAALERHGGNVSRTAEAVGMVRQSLQQKMRELGLRVDSGDDGK
jgi:DNA-binding NtrC family response regulator